MSSEGYGMRVCTVVFASTIQRDSCTDEEGLTFLGSLCMPESSWAVLRGA